MGVGDRHSKRFASEKASAPSTIQRPAAVDGHELDDPPTMPNGTPPLVEIVISRVRTLDDPLTTGVLAEIARSAVTSPELRSRTTRDDIAMPRPRTERRPFAREEPFRKK